MINHSQNLLFIKVFFLFIVKNVQRIIIFNLLFKIIVVEVTSLFYFIFDSSQAMREAAQRLEGPHDFRNLCKMDIANGVVNYTRNIFSTDIAVIDER